MSQVDAQTRSGYLQKYRATPRGGSQAADPAATTDTSGAAAVQPGQRDASLSNDTVQAQYDRGLLKKKQRLGVASEVLG